MKLTTRLGYFFLLWSFKLIGLLPTWFLYHCLVDVIYFFFYKIAKYRVKVVRLNLQNSFPERSAEERIEIERRFYRHLAEVVIDTIDIVSITRKQIEKRIVYENGEDIEKQIGRRNWIAALAHYGSWEYFISYQIHSCSQIMGIYRPLHNAAFDKLYFHFRQRFGLQTIAMHDLLRFIVEHRNSPQPYAYGMLADQTPPVVEKPHWYDFLNQKTAFYMGIEKLAIKFNMPVIFLHIEKRDRIRYRGRFEMIYDGNEKVEPGEITRRYVRKLEEMILERPELWMWSHRRWKHKPEDYA